MNSRQDFFAPFAKKSLRPLREKISIVFILCICATKLVAQQKNIPLSYDADWFYNFTDNNNPSKQPIHSGFKPAIENADEHFISEYSFRNSVDLRKQLDSTFNAPPRSKWLRRKLKHESLFIVNDTADKFHMTIDPLFNFQLTRDNDIKPSANYYTNTRGFIVRGDIAKNFSFESSFYENQATYPGYIADFANAYKVIPGQGRWKTFKTTGYDYSMASGYLSYSPGKHINIQLGTGKNFVGDGYRSLLLSDNAFNYPYLRVTTTFGHFQYTNLYAVFMNLSDADGTSTEGTETLFQKKAASFQYLNWNVTKHIQLGLFQGMIWEGGDDQNRQHLNLNYFNPVILSNVFVYGLDNTNNVLLGSTAKIKILKNNYLYGQFLLDDYDASFNSGSVYNKHGFQLGLKTFDLFKIKNLNLLVEYNQVRPYTYAALNPEQNYTHYGQSLADPFGANFKELIGILSYRYKDFIFKAKEVSASLGVDQYPPYSSPGVNTLQYFQSNGNNIFSSDLNAVNGINSTNNYQNQGKALSIINTDISIAYLINPITNMQLAAGVTYREDHVVQPATYFYLSFKTSLSNIYYDF